MLHVQTMGKIKGWVFINCTPGVKKEFFLHAHGTSSVDCQNAISICIVKVADVDDKVSFGGHWIWNWLDGLWF